MFAAICRNMSVSCFVESVPFVIDWESSLAVIKNPILKYFCVICIWCLRCITSILGRIFIAKGDLKIQIFITISHYIIIHHNKVFYRHQNNERIPVAQRRGSRPWLIFPTQSFGELLNLNSIFWFRVKLVGLGLLQAGWLDFLTLWPRLMVRPLGPYCPGPLIILKNIKLNMLQDHIWKAYCSRSIKQTCSRTIWVEAKISEKKTKTKNKTKQNKNKNKTKQKTKQNKTKTKPKNNAWITLRVIYNTIPTTVTSIKLTQR